jgi:chemotaxis family two-component system sensor kinase Cph1
MSVSDDFGQGDMGSRSKDRLDGTAARKAPAPVQLVHLPTWSRLNVASKQWALGGNGGDFFEVIQQRDGRVTTVMADVCGNGPSASAPVANLRWILRQQIAAGGSPGAVLATLNDWLVRQKTDDRFVTAVCVRIDVVGGRAEIASAGHLGPFVKRAGGGAEDLPCTVGLALGILPEQTYRETTVDLAPEDTVVLVTDGITDRLATADDPLGQQGLIQRLARARHGTESVCSALLGPDIRAQDATVVVMQLPRRHRRATPLANYG